MLGRIRRIFRDSQLTQARLESIQQALGRIELRQVSTQSKMSLEESEFQVYSQWGEDGIIQHLIDLVSIPQKVFIEFGVENYTQANTRFLLKNNNWSGLVMDGSEENIQYIKRDPIYWSHNLKVVHAFIDRNNINSLISSNALKGDIGLLSIDIDGNDYWVWDAIDVVSPRIVICEYNSRFGPLAKVTVPYDPSFIRSQAHFSNLYYGASIAALADLGDKKGYVLVGGNRAGNNVFFVRKDVAGGISSILPETAFRQAQFRESRGVAGELTVLDWEEGFGLAADLPVVDLETGALIPLNALNSSKT